MSLCARCQANYDEDQIQSDPALISGGWCAPAEFLASTIFNLYSCDPIEMQPYRKHLREQGWTHPIRAYREWQEHKLLVGQIAHGYAGPLWKSLPQISANRGAIKYERIRLTENE